MCTGLSIIGSQTDVFKSDNQAAERGRVSVVNVGREFAEGREGGDTRYEL